MPEANTILGTSRPQETINFLVDILGTGQIFHSLNLQHKFTCDELQLNKENN